MRPVQQVQFTDNFVDGVSYTTTSGLSGTTGTNESTGEAGAQGSFLYRAGDTITLTLGSVIIAEFSADQVQGDVLFLQDIAGVPLSDVNNEYVENMAIFLQALDADANPENGIQITPETAAFFEGYTDAGTGEALNLATAGKQMLANALSAADEFTPEGFVFTAVSETDPVQEDGSQNVFETGALDHVAETIEDLSDGRDPEGFDERTPDTIEVPGGVIDYNFNFDAGQNGEITFTRDDLLVGAVPQQVTYDNLEVSEVALSEGFTDIGELTFDEATGVYTIALNEGITRADVSGLTVDYQVRDWTAVVDAVATTLDESALTGVDDTAQGDEDTAILGSVADNDTTTSGGTLSYAINTDLFVAENEDGSFTLSQGVLTLDPEFSQNGQYSFQPNENYNGTDSFSYTVTDSESGERAVQTVTITVDAFDDAPKADDNDITVVEDAAATSLGLSAPTTPDTGETLTITVTGLPNAEQGAISYVDGDATVAVTAGMELTGTQLENLKFTPTLNYDGSVDNFTYTVSDGTGSDTATGTVTLAVTPKDDAPKADDNDITVVEDAAATSLGLSAPTTPDTGETLTITVTGLPNAEQGAISYVDGDATVAVTAGMELTGTQLENLKFTPTLNYDGSVDNFTYTVSDGTGSDTATGTVTLAVTPKDDAPKADDNDITVVEDAAATSLGLSAPTTPDTGETLTITVTGLPNAEQGAISYVDGDATVAVTAGMELTGTQLENLKFTPTLNYDGSVDNFTYTVSDGTGSDTATGTVTLAVTPKDDAPKADDNDITVVEDAAATSLGLSAPTTPDTGETLTITVTGLPNAEQGAISYVDGDATVAVTAGMELTGTQLENLKFTPTLNYDGSVDNFTYTVSDGTGSDTATGTVTLAVTPKDDAPKADDNDITVVEDAAATSLGLSAPTTPDTGETLTITVTGLPNAEQGAISYVDGDATVAVTAGMELTGTQLENLKFTPTLNYDGSVDNFTYTVSDGTGSDTATGTVTLAVTPKDDAPKADDNDITVVEDAAATSLGLSAPTTPDTGETLTITVTGLPNAEQGAISYVDGDATVAVTAGMELTGTQLENLKFTPTLNYDGSVDNFTYTVSDGTGSDTATGTVTLAVTPKDRRR